MGQKVHPVGFRLGIIRDWEAHWFAEKGYAKLLHEDLRLRKAIRERLVDAGVPRIDIARSGNQVTIEIHTAKPGIVIGRSGVKVEELRRWLEKETGKKVRVNIQEIRIPELSAYLVAQSISDQLRRRVAFKRAIKQAALRSMQRGAKGVKVVIAGRLGGAEMSRREREVVGKVPLQTIRADIDFAIAESLTTFGIIGIKVWIYKGDILPQRKVAPRPAAVQPQQALVTTPPQQEPASVAVAQPEAPAQPAAPAAAQESV
jgi:small subunit ribosomal protein S3